MRKHTVNVLVWWFNKITAAKCRKTITMLFYLLQTDLKIVCLPVHSDDSRDEQQIHVLMTLTLITTKATAASLSKYILYSTCHSFWACNLMFAIKNSCACCLSEHAIYWINTFKSSVSFCDRLVSPRGIYHSKPQSAIPTLFSLPITRFISNCWLITKSYGLWERPQNGSLMFLWFSIGIAASLVFFL